LGDGVQTLDLAGDVLYLTLVDTLGGDDAVTTAWTHLNSAPTVYVGGAGLDTLTLDFTPGQLNEILIDGTLRSNLANYFVSAVANLDLSASTWHAQAFGFETRHLALANPIGTDAPVSIDTWKLLPAFIAGQTGDNSTNLIVGSAAGQTLEGNGGNDVLVAFAGGNTLDGGAGQDLLLGGGGNDQLIGGIGADALAGGSGADVFMFAELGTANADTIIDYNFAQGDAIDLSALLDSVFNPGDDIHAFVEITNTGSATEIRVDTAGGGNFTAGAHDVAHLSSTTPTVILLVFDGAAHLWSLP
jgi:Ca2+-binding RTX toxin-like protein